MNFANLLGVTSSVILIGSLLQRHFIQLPRCAALSMPVLSNSARPPRPCDRPTKVRNDHGIKVEYAPTQLIAAGAGSMCVFFFCLITSSTSRAVGYFGWVGGQLRVRVLNDVPRTIHG